MSRPAPAPRKGMPSPQLDEATLDLAPAGVHAELDRYIGYWQEYATSHEALDADQAIQQEVKNAALTLAEAAHATHEGRMLPAGQKLRPARQK